MAWPELSIEDFPPRRDDEPSSLRQDIIDELSDHFVCALNRELLKNPDESTAKQRVLNQFGDPIKIARQLWLDAMKEKIMSQRIMTGISAVMAVCCLAVVGIAWSMMQESRAFNLQMLEQFKQSQERSPAAESAGDLHAILFQLVRQGDKDKPAVGFVGKLTKVEGKVDRKDQIFTVDAVSDKSGLLDFGKLPWGKYSLSIDAPWGEASDSMQITTVPGRKYEQTIVCPAHAPQDVEVEFQVNWPHQPEGEDYYLLCDFKHTTAIRTIEKNAWIMKLPQPEVDERKVFLFDVKNNKVTRCHLSADGTFQDIDPQKMKWYSTVKTGQGIYAPPLVCLIRKNELPKLSEINLLDEFGVIRWFNKFDIGVYSQPAGAMFISPFDAFKLEPELFKQLEMQDSRTIERIGGKFHGFTCKEFLTSKFIATDQQPNVWKINIPDLFPVTLESGSSSSAP